ncbi:TonB-dependent receptor [Shimwellia blattae]|uniref:Putative exogenous TonB-dependent siderophore receptor R4 n=1 Tax=Shimwellia blattae (strain ATCC 29907 / DSM 4481 / JCM 1650 / NBRC 105725 / CDC 9005-74) TaxID=630626 RepID=I2B3Q8_SHIBC|nr:TonB-dependent receptor [Shimwellia blattae]AFJ45162.1 putative exogenous TonB-dependent siderophore receptor R4 [Shimwellia blattae DSM 4481 = NBRC 105725]GAB82387.1 colicin I outer membrane receptor [Shimwellia blattae DSM 4481 = NBRC 105725]VDY62646.1 Colicin I receptor precursor [Shimwellia blattae]VEC19358.1 Colicin I receptor precursor [Shimwellia blattae]
MRLSLITSALLASCGLASTTALGAEDVIVVTAAGHEQKLTNAAASISVIPQEALQTNKYNDLADALRAVEGVDVQSTTGKTGGLEISIRGMPPSYTLILIDGVRQNGSRDVTPNGFSAMNTSFMPPLSAIERIEVIRGPMSTLYGSDAIGGVVNVITKKSADRWKTSINSGINLQSDNKWGNSTVANFWSSGPLIEDRLALQVRGSTTQRQGSSVTSLSETAVSRIPYPTAGENYTIGTRLDLKTHDSNTLWLDLDSSRQRYNNSDGQLGSLTGGYDKTLRYERNKITLGHDTTLDAGIWKSNLSWNQTQNKGRQLVAAALSPENASLAGRPRVLNNTNTVLDTKFLTPLGTAHLLTIGGEFTDSRMTDGVVKASSGKSFHQKSGAVFAEDEWQLLEPLTLTWGTRYEHHDVFGGHWSPRAYLVWNVNPDWTVKGGVTTGYKAPSLGQLHDGISGVTRQGQVNSVGNPNLKPEESTSLETALYYDPGNGLNANITGFWTDYRNKIVSYRIDDFTNSFTNSGKARTGGIEFASHIPLGHPDWSLALNYTFTRSKQQDGINQGAPLNYTPQHMANARLNWQSTPEINLWLNTRYNGKSPRYLSKYQNLSPIQQAVYDDKGEYLKAWTVVDLGMSWKLTDSLTLNSAINNLLDKDFSDVKLYQVGRSSTYAGDYFQTAASTTGYVNPGRNYWLSVNYTF